MIAVLVFGAIALRVLFTRRFPGLPLAALVGGLGTALLLRGRAERSQRHRANEQDGEGNN